MKKYKLFLTLLIVFALFQQAISQTPQKFKYQGICRDNLGVVLQNQAVNVRLSIHDLTATGTIAYQETFAIITNQFGLINLDIGDGVVQQGVFSAIPWQIGDKFLEVEMDLGSGYVSMGTTQLLSVPYALHSKTAESITGAITETDPVFVVSPANGIANNDITNWNTVYGWGNHSIAGYLISEVDGSVTNEIQTLSISNDTIYLSTGGFAKLPAGFNGQYSSLTGVPTNVSHFTNDAGYLTSFTEIDGSVTNEIQTLSISNDTVYLSNGGFVKLPTGFNGQYSSLSGAPTSVSAFTNDAGYLTSFTEVDGSVTNEIQALSISNDTIYLSNGGFVKLPFGNAWSLNGNAGTLNGTNFIGTTDNVPFCIKVNNENSGKIDNILGLVFLGYQAGVSTTGFHNVAIGQQALQSSTGTENTAIGYQALQSNSSGFNNTAVGASALQTNTSGNHNAANGFFALLTNTTGSFNTANGVAALRLNTSGSNNTANGYAALLGNTTGNDNTANGYLAIQNNNTGNNNTAFGSQSLFSNIAGSNATAIGYNAMYYANNTTTAFDNYNIAVGFEALRGSTNAAANTGNFNTAIGYQTLLNNTTGSENSTNGYKSLSSNTTGIRNSAFGNYSMLFNTTGSQNTAIGAQANGSNTTGSNNTSNGYMSLGYNTVGNNNTAFGSYSGYSITSGSGNVFLGYQAGYNELGSNKLYIANSSTNSPLIYGDFSTGNVGFGTNVPNARLDLGLGYGASGEKFLLYNDNTSGPLAGTKTGFYLDRFSLQNNVTFVFPTAPAFPGSYMIAKKNTASTTLVPLMTILGESGNVGIGTTNPTAKFEVIGQVRITGGAPGLNKILSSDATGLASWSTVAGIGAWSTTGNSGTIDGTNFIGTTDNIPLNFRVNNQKAGRIDMTLANTFLGYLSGNVNTTGYNNISIGSSSFLTNTSGFSNTAIGVESLRSNTTGNNNNAEGFRALFNNSTGSNNSATGAGSLYFNTIGIFNTANGVDALNNNISGNYNTSVGSESGLNNVTGSYNVFLGYRAGSSETGSSKLYIANSSANPPLIYGDFASSTVGIGTITPGAPLSVRHSAYGTGFVVWNSSETNDAIQLQNSNVASTINAVNESFIFANNGTNVITINNNKVGIGTIAPAAKLEVAGQVKITGGTPGIGKVLTSDGAGLATWEAQENKAHGMAYRSSTFDIPIVSTWTDLPLNGGNNNLLNVVHSTVTNPERLMVSVSGTYLIQYTVHYRRQAFPHHGVARLIKNSSDEITGSYTISSATTSDANEDAPLTGHVITTLSANDYINIQVATNWNAANEIDVYSGLDLPVPTTRMFVSLTIVKVGN